MKDERNNKSKIYTKWRYEVYVRDEWKCKHCGVDDNLQAHHIIPWDESIELRYAISNGLTLCSGCHLKHHAKGRVAWNKGKKATESMRRKLSESHKGQVAWNKGKKMTEEYCKIMSNAKLGKKIKPMSDEHKDKIRQANKKRLQEMAANRIGMVRITNPITGKLVWTKQ